jgi:ABC-2 type transport system permease protein
MIRTIAAVTVRSLLGRRRSLLLVLLALLPIAIALLIRASGRLHTGGHDVVDAVMDRLIVTTLLPLVALVFGTAVLGSEIEDGTAVFLIVKPVERWRIVTAKLAVAVGLAVAIVAPTALISGFLLETGGGTLAGPIGAAIGASFGAAAYVSVFFALSLVTSRALAIGIVYVIVWEGILAGLLEGTRVLSIRQYTLGITAFVTDPGHSDPSLLDGTTALLLAIVAIAVGALIAVRRLSTFEIGQATD